MRDPRALIEPLELSEHRALMLGRNAEAGVPDLDPGRAANSTTTDQHSATQRIFKRVRNEVLQQAPHETPIGTNGERGLSEDEIEPLRPGEGGDPVVLSLAILALRGELLRLGLGLLDGGLGRPLFGPGALDTGLGLLGLRLG